MPTPTSPPLDSAVQPSSSVQATVQPASQLSQGFAAERAADADRKRAARARESLEQTAARNTKMNEKHRIARRTLSQVNH